MARIARVVIPNYPHHVTQRGSRRQKTFFCVGDYEMYIDLLSQSKRDAGVAIWAYCLMPNHVHLVVIPEHKDSLAKLFRSVHRKYTRFINYRQGWQGHLWQERFRSSPMDEQHLNATVRYVELNPVRASLCEHPSGWKWSSVHAHLSAKNDKITEVAPMLERFGNWSKYLADDSFDTYHDKIRSHGRTGRPAGSANFLIRLEKEFGLQLQKGKPGRPTSKKAGN
jgi:putative transposase